MRKAMSFGSRLYDWYDANKIKFHDLNGQESSDLRATFE